MNNEPWVRLTFDFPTEIVFFDLVLWQPSQYPIQAWVAKDSTGNSYQRVDQNDIKYGRVVKCDEKKVIDSEVKSENGTLAAAENGTRITVRISCGTGDRGVIGKEIGVRLLNGGDPTSKMRFTEIRAFTPTLMINGEGGYWVG